jgi:periplasmic protein CpxP/Spy
MSNNKMKSICLTAAIVVVGTLSAVGQGMAKKTAEERATMQVEWAKKNLALTGDQPERLHQVTLKYAKKRDSVMAASGSKRGDARYLMDARDNEVKQVLTPEQYTKYKAHQSEMAERMEQRGRR